MPDFDYKSFMAGLQVGRRIRLWDAIRPQPVPPVPAESYIITETEDRIISESGDYLITE